VLQDLGRLIFLIMLGVAGSSMVVAGPKTRMFHPLERASSQTFTG
jgi:hypothetical protein